MHTDSGNAFVSELYLTCVYINQATTDILSQHGGEKSSDSMFTLICGRNYVVVFLNIVWLNL